MQSIPITITYLCLNERLALVHATGVCGFPYLLLFYALPEGPRVLI